jgi:N-acetylglucosamine kinase-like BadF-type ATPase
MDDVEQLWLRERLKDVEIYLFMGSAGFSKPVREDFSSAMYKVLPKYLNGSIVKAGAANDTVTQLIGYQSDGAVIAGTGSNIICKNNGEMFQAGGQDWVAYDNGSGFWIALRAIRKVARDFEKGDDSVLRRRFEATYNVDCDSTSALNENLRRLAVVAPDMKARIAHFAQAVCDAAELGDTEAQNIVKLEAEDLADSVAIVIRRHYSPEEREQGLTFVQCGSIIHNDFFSKSFHAQLQMRLLSGNENQPQITWLKHKDGTGGCKLVAEKLSDKAMVDSMLEMDVAYRPVILNF